MDIIKEIGAYAGFAAVVGLAVLSALYFSQARDVKRLREWAGRAPDRPPTLAAATQAQPLQRQAGAARIVPPAAPQRPTGGAPPGQKPPQTGRPVPTPAKSGAATPAGAAASPRTPGAEDSATPAGAAASRASASEDTDQSHATDVKESPPAGGDSNGEAPAAPATPPPIARRTVPPPSAAATLRTSAPTSVLRTGAGPARAAEGRSGSGSGAARSMPAPKYLAVMIAGLLVIGGGAIYGVGQLVSGEDTPTKTTTSDGNRNEPPPKPTGKGPPPAVNPSAITVAVLNGTTVPGLAATVADSLQQAKFQRGNVTNSTDQRRAESVVQYNASSGGDAKSEAEAVAKKLKIPQVSEIDPKSQQLAGNASVVVIVGQDRAN